MGEEVNVYERVSYDSATATNAELAYNDDWEKQLYTKLDLIALLNLNLAMK